MSETIFDCDFTKYLPQPLTHDPKMVALAKAATKELLEVSGVVEDVLIYSRIDELPMICTLIGTIILTRWRQSVIC